MTLLVTGSTGMLGTSLCRLASQKGHRVVGMSRGKMPLRPLFENETHRRGDLRSEEAVAEILRSEKPEVVIHAAALTDVDLCERDPALAESINAAATMRVARGAAEIGALLCYVSTDYVFDGQSRMPYREEDPVGPVSVYAKTKVAGEKAVASRIPSHYIVRTSWLFGEEHDSFVHHVLSWAETKTEITLVDDKWSIPSYTPDVAAGMLALIEKRPSFGVYHLSNGGGGCSWLGYGEEILRRAGLGDRKVVPISLASLNLTAPRAPMTTLNIEKFRRHVMAMRDWREALGAYVTTTVTRIRRDA